MYQKSTTITYSRSMAMPKHRVTLANVMQPDAYRHVFDINSVVDVEIGVVIALSIATAVVKARLKKTTTDVYDNRSHKTKG